MRRHEPIEISFLRRTGVIAAAAATLVSAGSARAAATATAAATADEQPVFVAHEFHKDWTNDRAYIARLVHDGNPRYQANKRLVLDFEAALEHAQTVKDGEPGSFDEVVEKYLTAG